MLQIVQDLRSGAIEVVDVPAPRAAGNRVLVRTAHSVISPGTEQAVSSTAAKSLVGKALERPDQVRKVVDKASRDGVRAAYDATRARLDDVLTPGYSSSGVIEAIGPEVAGLTVGMRVGCVGANAACHAELALVPAPLCLPLPAGLEDRWGAFGALGGVAAHGVRVAGVEAGSVVAVIGLGLVGQLAAQLATAAGARVVAVDVSPARVELARELGAVAGTTGGPEEVDALVRAHSGGAGADAVIVAAATRDSGPVATAATIARDRATISVVGDVGLELDRAPFYEKELELRVSRSYGPGRYDASYEEAGHDYPIGYVRWTERRLIAYFFEEVAAGRVRLEPLVSHEFSIGEGERAYAALQEPGRMAILLRYPEREAAAGAAAVGSPVAAPPRLDGPAATRAGVIGPGAFARATLLPRLAKAGFRIGAVAGTSPARAFGVARRWGAPMVATDPAEVIGDPSIGCVVIATRHDSHAALAADALRNGKAVFLEKPLAIEPEQVEPIEALLRQGGRLVVDFNRDWAPSTRRVLAHFAERTDPIHVGYRVNAGFLPAGHWLRDRAAGGGRLVGEGCHFVELCSTLVGAPLETLQVRSLGAGPRSLAGDNFVLTLSYADGSVATVVHVADGSPRMPKERVEVLGAGRSAVIDNFRRVDLFTAGARDRAPLPHAQDKGHGEMLARSAAFFRAGGDPPVPYDRLLETTRATFAARDALAQGRTEPVTLDRGA